MLKIFPHILCRVGGLPFDVLEQLRLSDDLQSLFDKQHESNQQFEEYKSNLLTDLKTFTPVHFAFANIRKIKKKVYKSQLMTTTLFESLDEVIGDKLLIYNHLLNELKTLNEEVLIRFDDEQLMISERLQELAKHPNFQKALPLSSFSFVKRLQSYLRKHPKDFRKKEWQTERTVMQYIARMAAKTSPFSSFTTLSYGRIGTETKSIINPKQKQKIQLNAQLLQLLQMTFVGNPKIVGFLNIRLNSTLERLGESYKYLVNVRNTEAFQEVEQQPILELIENLLIENESITINQLVDLLEDEIEAERSDLFSFVNELVEIGFIEIHFGYHGNTPNWLEKVIDFINKTQFFEEKDSHFFQKILKQLSVFSHSNMLERVDILEEIYQGFQLFFDKYNVVSNFDLNQIIPPEQLIYEDVGNSTTFTFQEKSVNRLVTSLNSLLQTVHFVQGKERLQVQHFFNEYYGETATVPLLDFYENYYKIGKKIKETDIPTIQAEAELVKKWKVAVKELITKTYEKGTTYDININDLQQINKDLKIDVIPLNESSLSCFAQVYQASNDGELKAVLNAVSTGYGKMTGRFLTLMPEVFTDDLRKYNKELSPTKILADNVDASFFNANQHPQLLEYEISMPESQNQLSENEQLRVKDLAIRNINKKLVLWHQKLCCEVQVFDLGIQTPKGRSPLYQLLTTFSPIKPSLQYLEQTIQQVISIAIPIDNTLCEVIPRVTFGNWTIMRKQWKCPIIGNLDKLKNVVLNEEYQKIRNLQLNKKNAKKYYVRNQTIIDENRGNLRKKAKPLYLDINNMILLNSSLKSQKYGNNIYNLIEVLPQIKNLLKIKKKKFFVECVFQWYSYQ